MKRGVGIRALTVALVISSLLMAAATVAKAQGNASQRPNIVMLMTDDTGWNDFGAYSGRDVGYHATAAWRMERQ